MPGAAARARHAGEQPGLSVVAKTYDDGTAFRVAAAHEERFAWFDGPGRRPALP